MNKFMEAALEEAFKGMRAGEGGPFGAVIVLNGEIIAAGHNEVVKYNDPTAHAEMVTIRKATSKLGRFDLSDCEIYTTCEPCPMCFSAIHWAKMKKMYFGASRFDAADIDFDDQYIYDVINGTATELQVGIEQIDRKECLTPFTEWSKMVEKVPY